MTNTLEIKLLSDNATKPKRNNLDAGYDIYAAETVILEPQQKALVATDLAVNIPKGYVGLLTSRSGVSSKTHLIVETGKIDAGYTGHMKINIKNDMEKSVKVTPKAFTTNYMYGLKDIGEKEIGLFFQPSCYQINKGDRLAQLVIVPIWTPELELVEEFESETARGQNGFGSSGTR
ncbi:dUTP pyrophosphatase [Staphylococcus saprophyticus]|uniref:dUTP diphosphatase n=1 Tax=Staphylococcus saprophyticus TaxID=29385 RepID=UPI000CD0EC41|nr:dUTP pyrophosphatase [Staphylococcus saprophyticus]PNZ69824.1 dUTP pyrophosphatase [Staphylococcus saprophyticus]